jgi:hypothetical protein
MVTFAFLGNTLFLTILVSMLSHTFSNIVTSAVQEIQYRRAVLTFEGTKSDAIFAYMPPFNIVALVIMLPLKMVVSARMFHRINVAAVRVINLPTLLIIAVFERNRLWRSSRRKPISPGKIDWKSPGGPLVTDMEYWRITRFSAHADVYGVFEVDPPQSVLDKIAEDDDFSTRDMQAGSSKGASNLISRNIASADPTKPRRKSSRGGKKLNEIFAASDDEDSDHPAGYKKVRRGERMDSIIDFASDHNEKLLEATARLHKLEDSVGRIEAMLSQMLDGDASDQQSKGEQELEDELRTQSVK